MSGTMTPYGGLSLGLGPTINPLTGRLEYPKPGVQPLPQYAGLNLGASSPTPQAAAPAPQAAQAPAQSSPPPVPMDPMGMGGPGPQPAPPPVAPSGPANNLGPVDDFGNPVDPEAGLKERYQLPAAPRPAAPPTYQGPSDPAAFSALDYVGANGLPGAQPSAAPSAPAGPPDSAGQRGEATMNRTPAAGPLDQSRLDALWTKITGGESGGSSDPTHAKNPKSSAYGKAQFIDSTRDAFLSSPAGQGYTVDDFKNNPDVQRKAFDWNTTANNLALSQFAHDGVVPDAALEAAHALGAGGVIALMQQPGANALKAYADGTGGDAAKNLITNNKPWGITKDDTADQALHKIAGYYEKRGAPKDDPAATPAAQSAPSADPGPPKDAPAASGPSPSGASPINTGVGAASFDPTAALANYRPVQPSDQMLAAASGILQGGGGLNGLVRGMGMGIDKAQALGITDQNNRYKIAQEAANTQLLKQRLGLVSAQTDAIPAKLAIQQQGADAKTAGVGIQQQNADTRAAGVPIAQQNADTRSASVDLASRRLDANLSGAPVQAAQREKDNQTIENTVSAGQASAGAELPLIANLQNVIKSDPNVVGSDAKAQVQRFFANNLGVDVGVNPDANSIAQKLVTELNNTHALSGAKAMLGRVTQGEANFLKASAANIGTRPDAFQAFLGDYQTLAQNRLALAGQLHDLQSNPQAYQAARQQPGGLRTWMDKQLDAQLAARGITSNGPAPADIQQSPGGKWQHVSPQGLGFSIN